MESLNAIVGLIVSILAIVGTWRLFVRAGEPGWAAIVPIYNIVVWLRVANKPVWWIVGLLVPVVNVVVAFLVWREIAARFGRGTGFAIGLLLLAPIFLFMIGPKEVAPQPRFA